MRNDSLSKEDLKTWTTRFVQRADVAVPGFLGNASAEENLRRLQSDLLAELTELDQAVAQILRRQLSVFTGVRILLFAVSVALVVALVLVAVGQDRVFAGLLGGGSFIGFVGWWLMVVRRTREDELRMGVELSVLVPQFRLDVRTCESVPCLRDVSRRLQARFAEVYRTNATPTGIR